MAQLVNSFATFNAVGLRESLADQIYNINPTETPFISAIDSGKAEAVFVEWQTDTFAAAGNNKKEQGNEAAFTAITPTVRVGNRTQISDKTYAVTGTEEVAKKAGRGKETSFQDTKKMVELKKDIEFACLQNSVSIAAAAGVAPQARGVLGWIATNTSKGVGGVDPDPVNNVAQTDGTQRAFTETLVRDAAQKCWAVGGDPKLLFVPVAQRNAFDAFTAGAVKQYAIEDKKLTATINVYEGPFGIYKVVNSRYQRDRDVFGIDATMWELLTYRPMKSEELAKTGDSIKRLVLTEWTLKSNNEAGNFAVRDLT